MSDQKLVLLGVTGGIAAYKAVELVRLLQYSGLEVKVVMTEHATEFVGPATFRALSGHEVALDLFEDPGKPIHHISLSTEPDCFVIAPATANVIAKIAQGVADDLLTTTVLAYKGPLVIAPAMNEAMLTDVATQENLALLQARGVRIVDPENGYLACGDVGAGRLADIALICEAVVAELSRCKDLEGKHVVVTAGPTQEPIDAVRFISNHSSGKMGYALAREAKSRGAEVTLITGPVGLRAPEGITIVDVSTAVDMGVALEQAATDADIIVCAAAVSDFRPVEVSDRKLKKDSADVQALETIHLVENPDLLARVCALRAAGSLKRDPVIIGFAAETDAVVANARKKLASKSADLIVANDISRDDIGFGSDYNEVVIATHDGEETIGAAPKQIISQEIFDRLIDHL